MDIVIYKSIGKTGSVAFVCEQKCLFLTCNSIQSLTQKIIKLISGQT